MTQHEKIRISAIADRVTITISRGDGEVFFDAHSSGVGGDTLPEVLNDPDRIAGVEEYLISFEFAPADASAPAGTTLKKLDTHVSDLSITHHDDGYILEGALTAWVGYTDAYPDED